MLQVIRRVGTSTLTPDELECAQALLYRREHARERITRDLDAHTAGVDRAPVGLRRQLLTVHRAARRDGHDAVVRRIIENAPAEPAHP